MRVTFEDLCLPQKPPGCQSPNTAGVSRARVLRVCAGVCVRARLEGEGHYPLRWEGPLTQLPSSEVRHPHFRKGHQQGC